VITIASIVIGEANMNHFNSVLGGFALFASVSLQAATLTPVIDGFTLDNLLESNSVKVLEIRSDADAYAKAHIPGSVHLPYGAFRGPKNNPGKLPPLNELAKALGSVGLETSDAVVVVHDGANTTDFGAAARVYWTLKSVGFENLAILNGGFLGYQKDGFDLASEATAVQITTPVLTFDSRWYADTAEVASQVDGDNSARLLDARPDAFFLGKAWHGAMTKPGILPSADQFSFEAFFDKNTPLLKHANEVSSIVNDNGLNQANTISYCNTGHWAATNWFVLSEVAQVPDVKLYAESMVEWSQAGQPMENVPSALEFSLLKTQKWFNNLVN
jgi:thiosulfate/3-mercaptopyruvate sulfurtransferase